MNHKLDNDQQVFFYEQDFYVLSNFSAFRLVWKGHKFDTAEAAYHWEKFRGRGSIEAKNAAFLVQHSRSAHEAFQTAREMRHFCRPDWDDVRVGIMRDILREKADQHEYVRRKLLATGDRELIEDSWRDDFWGWGPDRDGQNVLGKLWMEIRSELRAKISREEPKFCPFCDRAPICRYDGDFNSVSCESANCPNPSTGSWLTPEAAVKNWNRRAP